MEAPLFVLSVLTLVILAAWLTRSSVSELIEWFQCRLRLVFAPAMCRSLQLKDCVVQRTMVAGLPVELVWANAQKTPHRVGTGDATPPPGPLIILIPGFPGVASLYADFLCTLSTSSSCAAVCISWCGHHELPAEFCGSAFTTHLSIEAHGDFMAAIVQHLRALPWVTKIVLVGHSLGCWYGTRALEIVDTDTADASVAVVCLLCPVLQNLNMVHRALRLRPRLQVARSVGVPSVIQRMALVLPFTMATMLHALWWMRGKARLERKEWQLFLVVVKHLQLGVVGRGVATFLDAFSVVGPMSARLAPMRKKGSNVAIHYALNDGWTPPEVSASLSSEGHLPAARCRFHAMPHGIVTDAVAAQKAAAMIGFDIATLLNEESERS